MASTTTWLQSDSPCDPVTAVDQEVVSKIWFKSKPVDRDFCFRVTQLQLYTDSYDQGVATDMNAGSWTWFELAILAGEASTETKKSKEGKELVWRSHSNRLANNSVPTRQFGAIFDRRSELLANLEVGDVLAVRACARYSGWTNRAENGYIAARVINEDLFTPHRWTLDSDVVPTLAEGIEDASYSFVSTTPCSVKSEGNDLNSKIWFTTAALDQAAIDKLKAIQLFTFSRFQESQTDPVPEGDCFSWFGLVILDSPSDTAPRVDNGVSLVWKSHSNSSNVITPFVSQGQLYDVEEEDLPHLQTLAVAIKGALKPGNVIGVRVNAQYPDWENYAKSGQLVVRLQNEVAKAAPTILPDVSETENALAGVQKAIQTLFGDINYTSATAAALSNEARADLVLSPPPAQEERPLRLLSLDGGGVRGVSSLRILKSLMKKVAEIEGKPYIKPCEYFDMMAGTSTGGLIALMLGRLHMTIDECETKYDEISKQIFGGKQRCTPEAAFLTNDHVYEGRNLTKAAMEVVRQVLGKEGVDALLLEENPQCRVLVMSALASEISDGHTAVHLRNYQTGQAIPSESLGWKIWEAGRATASAPIYFESFHEGPLKYIDGGMGVNNPSLQLMTELRAVYGNEFSVGCLVSVGTGISPSSKIGADLLSAKDIFNVAANPEPVHEACEGLMTSFPITGVEKYSRLNMSKKACEGDWVERAAGWESESGNGTSKATYSEIMAKIDDWKAIGMIRALTDKWLAHADVVKTVDTCAARLAQK